LPGRMEGLGLTQQSCQIAGLPVFAIGDMIGNGFDEFVACKWSR